MTPEELAGLAEAEQAAQQRYATRLLVCVAAGCLSSQSDQVKTALESEVRQRGLDETCTVKGVGCMGLCSAGPLVSVAPTGATFKSVAPEDAADIVRSLDGGATPERLACPTDQPFFTRQVKIVLENSGAIDPDRIEEYIAV